MFQSANRRKSAFTLPDKPRGNPQGATPRTTPGTTPCAPTCIMPPGGARCCRPAAGESPQGRAERRLGGGRRRCHRSRRRPPEPRSPDIAGSSTHCAVRPRSHTTWWDTTPDRRDRRRGQRPFRIAQIARRASALALPKATVLARPHRPPPAALLSGRNRLTNYFNNSTT
jgi:hypothetical protein